MLPDSANLTTLARRWRIRLVLARGLEAMFCLSLGVLLANCAALIEAAGMNQTGGIFVKPRVLLFLGPVAVAVIARVVMSRRKRITFFADMCISATIGGWLLVPATMWILPSARHGDALSLLKLDVLAIGLGAVMWISTYRLTSYQIRRWLDESIGSHLLLTTAGALSERIGPLSDVETAVVSRANALAARPEAFAAVSPWHIRSWRTWMLLPIAILAVVVAGIVGTQLHAVPIEETRNGKPTAAVQEENQSVAPIVAALIELATQPGGQPLTPVLLKPGQSADQIAAAVAAQVRTWQEDRSLTTEKRKELADQLRRTADRIRATDPEVAARLDRAADALAGGDWPKVAAEMAELARQVQPIIAAGPLPAAALVPIRDRLRASGATTTSPENPELAKETPYAPAPAIPPAAVGGNNVTPPGRGEPIPIDPSVRDYLSKLPVDQQQVVRRYFEIN